MKKHFVTFYSPGTFVSEQTMESIDSWDVEKAVEMSKHIWERHNAKPYGFRFTTRERKDDELDSIQIETSGTYFLGGRIITLAEIEAENDPANTILISNMRCNGWDKVIENTNSWKITLPFTEKDILLEGN